MPSTAPSVAGTMSSRSEARAAFDFASVPVPSIGRSIWATVPALFTSTVIGWWKRPPASAACGARRPRRDLGRLDRRRLDDDRRRILPAGERLWSRLYVCTAGRSCGSASAPGTTVFIPSAGSARAISTAVAAMAETSGWASTRSRIQPHARPPSGRCRRWRNGTRALLTRSPSQESSAGSTVNEPSTAIATTRIVADRERGERRVARSGTCRPSRSSRSGRRSAPSAPTWRRRPRAPRARSGPRRAPRARA